MRETVVAVVAVALLGAACEGKTSSSTPPAAQTSPPAAAAPAPAAAPAESAKAGKAKAGKVKKTMVVAWKAQKVRRGSERKVEEAASGDPRAPTLRLNQSPPSSY
jgi:hypothetical protein